MMMKLSTAVTAIVLGVSLSQFANAFDDKGKPEDKPSGQKTGKDKSGTEAICGIVAGVTAEGEMAYDAKNHRTAAVEAAYLTVVGSPKMWKDGKDRTTEAAGNKDDKGQSGDKKSAEMKRHRESVYIVFLSPRTKVNECADANKPDQTKDVGLAGLELGDRVEIQFQCREESAENTAATKNDPARLKHGRHRTYFGDATEIKILPMKHSPHANIDSDNDKAGTASSESKPK